MTQYWPNGDITIAWRRYLPLNLFQFKWISGAKQSSLKPGLLQRHPQWLNTISPVLPVLKVLVVCQTDSLSQGHIKHRPLRLLNNPYPSAWCAGVLPFQHIREVFFLIWSYLRSNRQTKLPTKLISIFILSIIVLALIIDGTEIALSFTTHCQGN